ncbi:MAG: hypothetical protein ACLGHO_11760 [Gammaproteobacteria bacterium]
MAVIRQPGGGGGLRRSSGVTRAKRGRAPAAKQVRIRDRMQQDYVYFRIEPVATNVVTGNTTATTAGAPLRATLRNNGYGDRGDVGRRTSRARD